MFAYVILGALLGLPLLLGLVFRVGTQQLFLTLLAAELLERYFKDDAILALRTVIRDEGVLAYVGLAMLVLPMLLTAVFLRNTLSKGGVILHSLPLMISGVVFAAFAVPLLPPSLLPHMEATKIGSWLLDSTDIIVGVMVLLHLFEIWFLHRPHKRGHKKHH